jgi:hypothetical protein
MDAAPYAGCDDTLAQEIGYLMQVRELKLKDGSGGLNKRDFPSKLKDNEFAEAINVVTDEGGLYKTRGGKDILQYAPIDPRLFETDDNTIALWHLDESNPGPWLDSSVNGNHLSKFYLPVFSPPPNTVPALFPLVNPLGVSMIPADSSSSPNMGQALYRTVSNFLDDFAGLTVDAWIKIPSTFSGKPISGPADANHDLAWAFTNSGAPIFSTFYYPSPFPQGPIANPIMNGIFIIRPWAPSQVIATVGADKFAPRIVFRLKTKGIAGTVTTVVTQGLPFDTMLHIRARYNASTGFMGIEVNGILQGNTTVIGAGAVDDFGSNATTLGGIPAFGNNSTTFGNYEQFKVFNGVIDEVRISNIDRGASSPNLPYLKGRGLIPEFVKSDGTRQNICAAEDGLFYTINNGDWTAMGRGFDSEADWEFRQFGDIMYMCNGVNDPYAWDGSTLKPMGEALNMPTVTQAAGPAGPTAGLRKYAYAYFYGNNLITGLSPIAEITSDGNNVNVDDLLCRHSNCQYIQVYRTKAGEDTFYLIRQIENAPGSPKVSMTGAFNSAGSPLDDEGADGVLDDVLGTGDYEEIDPFILGTRMRKWRFSAVNYETFFMAGMSDAQYDLDFSEKGAPDVRPALNFATAKTDKGPLVALASYYGEIHASKNGKATLVLRGDNPNNWRQLETLHPEIGCVDHWSYVHRTLSRSKGETTDRYMLTFLALDGFYGYLGGEFFKISDLLGKVAYEIGATAASRQLYSTGELSEYLHALSTGGSATQNIYNPRANTDGLILEPGKIQISDQRDYMGLWDRTASSTPSGVSGRVICAVKGAAEGEFYFATDGSANTVFRTTDNFNSATALGVAPGAAGAFIVFLVRATVSGMENLFVFTGDSADEKGSVFRIIDPYGASGIGPNLTTLAAGPFYWRSDTRWRAINTGAPQLRDPSSFTDALIPDPGGSGYTAKNFYTLGNPGRLNPLNSNLYLNHDQKVLVAFNSSQVSQVKGFINTGINTAAASPTGDFALVAGYNNVTYDFISARDSGDFFQRSGNFAYDRHSSDGLSIDFQRRETALFQGGAVSPQAYFDSTNGKLYFVAGTAPDATSGIILNNLYSLNITTLALVTVASSDGHIAFTAGDPGFGYFNVSAIESGGFNVTFKKVTFSSDAVATVSSFAVNQMFYRFAYDSNSGKIFATGKRFPNAGDFYTNTGTICSITLAGVLTDLKVLPSVNGEGYYPLEIAIQTTSPNSIFVLMQGASAPAAVYQISTSGVVTAYKASYYAGVSTGASADRIISPAIFVANSGVSGNFLWADRLYWGTKINGGSLGSIIQLGVPGSWRVQATMYGEQRNIGNFSAFGSLLSEFSGTVDYQFSNATDAADLLNNMQNASPNSKIVGFNPPEAFVQWAVTLTWDYTGDIPSVSFVNVEYYVNGSPQNPRVTGMHFQGRTYWAVSIGGSPVNNKVFVYQKNNTWTTYENWRIKGFGTYGNKMVALEDYNYVQLETGNTDAGEAIRTTVITGGIMDEPRDKAIKSVISNVRSYLNDIAPTQKGYVKVTPIRAGQEVNAAAWIFEIPADTEENSVQVMGFPLETDSQVFLGQGWCRAMQIKISSSEETDYEAPAAQVEKVEQILVQLYVSPPRQQMSVD